MKPKTAQLIILTVLITIMITTAFAALTDVGLSKSLDQILFIQSAFCATITLGFYLFYKEPK